MQFERIKKLQKIIDIPYYTDFSPELIYLCGYTGTFGGVLVLKDDFYFFTDSRYFFQYKEKFDKHIIMVKSSLLEGLKSVVAEKNVKKLQINSEETRYSVFLELENELKNTEIIPGKSNVNKLRVLKEKDEIEKIKSAIRIAQDTFLYILTFLKPGISEWDIAVELRHTLKLKGAEDNAFDPIVLFGERSAYPHGKPSKDVKLKSGHVVLIDMGARYANYNSDMTRTFCFGKIPDDFEKVYNIVLSAQQKAFDTIKPGVDVKTTDKAARDYIASHGYGEYFGHGLGHGIGIQVHEKPRISYAAKGTLEIGMVFSNEPGIYLPGKFGIRIEDMVVLRSRGSEWLTDLPKQKVLCV